MKSILHIAALDTLADWEIGYLTAHVNGPHRDGDFTVRLVGLTLDPIQTSGGLTLTPDLTVTDLRPEDGAMLVLSGSDLWHDDITSPFIAAARAFLDAGTPVAAICGATYALARAGLLDERPHTSNDPGYLASSGYSGGEHYQDHPAVTDGDLITASGVAPVHFARAVFERLGAYDAATLASWFKLYADRDPAGFYELMSA